VHAANLHLTGVPSAGALGRTSVVLFFAFLGFESALNISGEVTAPARTVPRAILVALTLIATLYLGLQAVAQGVLGPSLATAGDAPLGATALAAFGAVGGTIIVLATVLSTAGCVAGDLLATPRVLHVLGRDGLLPRPLAQVSAGRVTPALAIVVYGSVCAALALSGTFRVLATLGASGTLCIYFVCCAGLFRLRARGVRGERAPFVVPGGPVVPILATLAVLLVLSGLEAREFLMLGAVLSVAVVASLLRRRPEAAQAGAAR
jgi:amino acid transporter